MITSASKSPLAQQVMRATAVGVSILEIGRAALQRRRRQIPKLH
jgi:hypothetical protein